MPREITHWAVLSESGRILAQQHPSLNQALAEFPAAAKLGAVLHDAPYFHRRGRSDFQMMSEVLHGAKGEDTLLPLRALARAIDCYGQTERALLTAILIGMLSHYATDLHFHPLVYFLTGNYYDTDLHARSLAQIRHRRFEVYLDAYVSNNHVQREGHSISRLVSQLRSQLPLLSSWLSENLQEQMPGHTASDWRESISELSRYQGIFINPMAGACYKLANKVLGGKLNPIESLFRKGRESPLPIFSAPISYRNPVSGAEYSQTIEELIKLAANETVRMALLLTGPRTAINSDIEYGASLNFGIPNTPPSLARYFEPLISCV